MDIHSQLVLRSNALEGTQAPGLRTFFGLLTLLAVIRAIEAARNLPARWSGLKSRQRAGRRTAGGHLPQPPGRACRTCPAMPAFATAEIALKPPHAADR
jgi:hypothetical protein